MKKYNKPLEIGLKIIYDGHPIEWCNHKGKVLETMKPGEYVISRITDKYVYFKSDRKNAVSSYGIHRDEIEKGLYELEFEDLTTSAGMIFSLTFMHKDWIVNDEELITKAKKYNKERRWKNEKFISWNFS